MNIRLPIPKSGQRPKPRAAAEQRIYFTAREEAAPRLHSHVSVHGSDLGYLPEVNFRVASFNLRPMRLTMVALLAAALLPLTALPQSLWRDTTSRPMFADKRATAIGDILTIIVQETSTATKNNATKTERSSSLTAAISSFFYSPAASGLLTKGGQLPSMQYSSDHKHDGSGSINNSENIIARVAVKVVDVLPNKNLVIEGKRETSFGGERQTVVLRGIVRSEDIQANDTVFSYNVADATINIISKGTVTDGTRKGWFNRIWDKVNPF